MEKLFVEDSEGSFKEASDQNILLIASKVAKRKLVTGAEVENVEEAKKLLVPLLAGKNYEVFCAAFFGPQANLIAFEEMFRGTIDQVPAYPREVILRAIELKAVAMILVHNHPIGEAKPSKEDIILTLKMRVVGEGMGVRVLDHFIVAGDQVRSLQQSGDLSKENVMKTMMGVFGGDDEGETESHVIEIDGNDIKGGLDKLLKRIEESIGRGKKKLN